MKTLPTLATEFRLTHPLRQSALSHGHLCEPWGVEKVLCQKFDHGKKTQDEI
jgi:hypothetical protein